MPLKSLPVNVTHRHYLCKLCAVSVSAYVGAPGGTSSCSSRQAYPYWAARNGGIMIMKVMRSKCLALFAEYFPRDLKFSFKAGQVHTVTPTTADRSTSGAMEQEYSWFDWKYRTAKNKAVLCDFDSQLYHRITLLVVFLIYSDCLCTASLSKYLAASHLLFCV